MHHICKKVRSFGETEIYDDLKIRWNIYLLDTGTNNFIFGAEMLMRQRDSVLALFSRSTNLDVLHVLTSQTPFAASETAS